eukprot:scaffold114206_cov73-Attheya_sp.AAC.7
MNFEGIDDILPEDVGHHIVNFLDVPTLVQKNAVCHSWQTQFTNMISEGIDSKTLSFTYIDQEYNDNKVCKVQSCQF